MAFIPTSRSTLTLVATLVALLTVSASASADSHPKETCFEKLTKCCYKFAPCGVVEKKVPLKARCDFEKCHNVCKPVCKVVHKEEPKTVCGHHGCHHKVVHFEEKICKSECDNVCKIVKAVCVKTQVYHRTKFCAKLECGKEEIVGSTDGPGDFVGKEGKLVQVIPGERKVLDDVHDEH